MKGYQKLIIVGMVTLLTVALVGCVNNSDINPAQSPKPSINPPNVTISPVPTEDLVLKDLDNQDVSLSSFQGKRVLIVFWNLLCSSNMNKLQGLQKLNELVTLQELKDAQLENLVILAITNQESGSIDNLKSYVTEQKFNYQFLYDETGKTYEKYKVKLVPHTILLDTNGKMVHEHQGEMSKEDYMKILNSTTNPTLEPTVKPTNSNRKTNS